MNTQTLKITSSLLLVSVYNIIGSGLRGLVKSEVLGKTTNTLARLAGDTLNCISKDKMMHVVSRIVLDPSKTHHAVSKTLFFLPIATEGLLYLSRQTGFFKKEAELINNNISKVMNVSTLVVSAALFPAIAHTALTVGGTSACVFTAITGVMIGVDAYCLYKSGFESPIPKTS